jgi:DNA primase catalytic core
MVASPISSTLQGQQGQQKTLSRCLDEAINSLSAEQIYHHPAHNFKHSGDRIRGGCPLHPTKSGSSFVVTISSKLFWCAGCGFGGSPADYRASLKAGRWVKARGKDFVDVVRELAAEANVPFPERESSPEEIAKAQKWERRRAVLASTQNYCQEILWSDRVEALEARHYLIAERGLTEEEIKQMPIGYYPSAGELKRHLIFKGFSHEDWKDTGCVWKDMERYITFLWNDANGRPLTIYGRYFKQFPPEGKPKTLATPGAKTKQSPLYFDLALKAGHKEIILVEGVLDAALLQAKGDTRVGAYVAASCSGDQIETLKRRRITKITLCGDPDHGGDKGTNSNLLRLTEAGIGVYIAPKLPNGLDPDEFLLAQGMEGWKAHINSAAHGFRWKAQQLIDSGDVTSDSGKAEVLHNAIAFCKAVKNHPDLDVFFWPIIRNNLGMEPEEFRAQLEKLWESSPTEVAELGGGNGSGGDDGDGGEGTGKVVRFPSFAPLTLEQVTEKIDELILKGATGSYLTGQLNGLAATSKFYVAELRKLYYERLDESDLEGERDSNRSEIENLLNLNDQSLDLADYLPQSLAEPISQWSNWLNIRPAVALTAILAGISSIHKTGTELVLQRNQNFRVPSTIYAALVSPSGQKKSPIFHNIIRQPLNTLEKEKLTAYEAAMADYEATLQQWEETKEGEKPQKPKDPPIYYFTNATGEAIPVQAGKDPSKTLLALIDELAGYFNSSNAYRNGRGSDKQDLLSYFDGSGQTILRASGVRVNLKNIYLSIFGTIQPEVLKRHMEDCSDPDGNWARFLFVNQPLQAATLHDDDGMVVQISDRLTDFYRQIDRLPEMEYRLSRQAFKRYQGVYNQLERLRVTHPQSGMAAVYSKMEGYIGRLALNLHVLWELDAGKDCPDEEIPLFIMDMAIQLAKFYIGQVKLIHANADDESLPTHIVKLIELSKRLEANGKDGWIKAQQYRDQFDSKKRPSAQKARDWMNEAVTLGYGRTRGTGNRLEYHWKRDNNGEDNQPTSPDNFGNLGKLREDLGKTLPVVETIENKGVENNLGNFGMGIPNFPGGESESLNAGGEASELSLEGGYLTEVSRSTPQESCDVEPVGEKDLGNNLGIPFPNLPEVPEVCDSSAPVVTVIEHAIAPTPVEQVDSTSADDSEEVIASQPQGTWAWSRKTGECLGQVLHDGGNRLKIRRTGEPASRAKWHERNQITFENPTVSALSLNTSPTTPVQWEDDKQFLEELDD